MMFAKDRTLSAWQSEIPKYITATTIYRVFLLFAIYVMVKVFYRLYLSPLSRIPGRKLAAATHLYAFYHDVIRQGLYIWEIEEMHKQYGPIVRISPDEIHVNDPEYIDQIYAGPGKRRDKGQNTVSGLSVPGTALGTQRHDLHKSRRAALNPFFSKQNIRRLEPTIIEVLERIFQRLDEHLRTKLPISMSLLYRAATHDIISGYALGDGNVCLSKQDLNQSYFESYHEMVETWHIGVYFPWIAQILRRVPPYVVAAVMPTARNAINTVMAAQAKIDKIRSSTAFAEETGTIFHGLLQSDLPESEKSSARLAEEAQVLLAAGTDSTANTLSAITYHLLTNPLKLQKLRAELQDAIPEGSQPTFSQIENLPYLSAVIQEGLRLHPAVSTRQERVATDEDLFYKNNNSNTTYRIPAGTCVSMSAVLLSRLPEIYPCPGEFLPERFLGNPKLKRYQLTFGRGTRICLGINLAYQELYMILASLFRRYDVWDDKTEEQRSSLALELFQTTREDIDIVRDLVTENVKPDSKGVRVVIRGHLDS